MFPDVTLHSIPYELVITMCQILIWFALYYFTFEMRLIQLALSSESPQIFHCYKKINQRFKFMTLSLLLLIGTLLSVVFALQFGVNGLYDHNKSLFDIL
jgi:hypothetical protein